MNDSRPDDFVLLARMRETLDRVLLVSRSAADEFGGDFGDPSPARAEWTACPSALAHDLSEAYRTGLVLWHSIEDYAHALSDLIESRRTYACMTVARSLAEAAVRSWYMLEPSDIEPIERFRRLINERLYAEHENEILFQGLLPSPQNPPDVEAVARAKEPLIRRRIAEAQRSQESLQDVARNYALFPIKRTKAKVPYVGGLARPSAMALLSEVLNSPSQAATFFRSNSSVAHASLHGQVRMIHIGHRDDGTDISRPRPMIPDDLAPQAWPGIAAMAIAANTLFRQAGWSVEPLGEAVDQLAIAWNPPPSADLLADFDAMS